MTTLLGAQPDSALACDNPHSVAYEASRVGKLGAGVLYNISGYNSGAAGFLQIYDAIALPADGAVPSYMVAIPGTGNFSFDFTVYGRPFRLGCIAGYSSTGPTKTIGGASVWFDLLLK